jgi:hypothetical protein
LLPDDPVTSSLRGGPPAPRRQLSPAATARRGGHDPVGGRRRIEGRPHVSYPSWLRLACIAIVVAHAAKFPPLVDLALSRAHQEPELTADLSEDLVTSSLRVGVGVLVLFGAIVSCVVLYAVTRSLLRRQARTASANGSSVLTKRNRALVRALSLALVLPDAWSAFGDVQAFVNPAFWVVLIAGVVALTWRAGGPRLAASGLALALGGVLL